ncbi:UNVERIFIED_CONTAM: hypothetical protein K2H54_027631 [Gekko kuhli]
MLQDFCETFATEDALGISSPVSAEMYRASDYKQTNTVYMLANAFSKTFYDQYRNHIVEKYIRIILQREFH